MSGLRNPFAWLALLLTLLVAADAARTFPTQVGIDFYHLWGVPMGQRASASPISPYAQAPEYAALLNALADGSGSEALRSANRFRREIVPTGTPLFYASFAFLPDDFLAAHTLFATLQYIAGAWAVFLLARLRGVPPWPALCVAFAVELTFNPFVQDVKWGNATAFQLLFIAGCLRVALRGDLTRGGWIERLFLAALAVFVLFKPNTIWIAAGLALHYLAVRGLRNAVRGALFAMAGVAAAVALAGMYFHNVAIWSAWAAYVRSGSLVYRFDEGNQSWPMLLAHLAPTHDAWRYGAFICLFLTAVLMALLVRDGRSAELRGRLQATFADPWAAAGIGVLFTLAAAPLVWPFYHLFALVPMAWLVRTHGRWDGPSWCALAAYAALSSPVIALLIAGEHYVALRLMMFLSWLPLVPAAMVRIAPPRAVRA